MSNHVLVWDLETVPYLPCVARVNGLDETDERAAREKLVEKEWPQPTKGLDRGKV